MNEIIIYIFGIAIFFIYFGWRLLLALLYLKGNKDFVISQEFLDGTTEGSKRSFEEYKATGKTSGWTRVD